MPGEPGVTVVTMLVCFFHLAREAAGAHRAPGIPCALISQDGTLQAQLARLTRRDREAASTNEMSCPDLIGASINLRESVFEADGLPGQARQ